MGALVGTGNLSHVGSLWPALGFPLCASKGLKSFVLNPPARSHAAVTLSQCPAVLEQPQLRVGWNFFVSTPRREGVLRSAG